MTIYSFRAIVRGSFADRAFIVVFPAAKIQYTYLFSFARSLDMNAFFKYKYFINYSKIRTILL